MAHQYSTLDGAITWLHDVSLRARSWKDILGASVSHGLVRMLFEDMRFVLLRER